MKAKKAKAKAEEEVDNTIPYEWPSLTKGTKWDIANEG